METQKKYSSPLPLLRSYDLNHVHLSCFSEYAVFYRGIAWAPACGMAMAELILDGDSKSINLRPFDPARFTPEAKRGGRGRKRQGTSVGEQW